MNGLVGWSGQLQQSGSRNSILRAIFPGLKTLERNNAAVGCQSTQSHCQQLDEFIVAWIGSPIIKNVQNEQLAATLAARYHESGIRLLSEIHGQFLLCLVNIRTGEGLVAVDRAGTYSLAWGQAAGTTLFSTSAYLVAKLLPGSYAPDTQAIYDYCYNHVIRAPDTLFENIHRLPAGHVLRLDPDGSRTEPYWTADYRRPSTGSLQALTEQFLVLLDQSVVDHINDNTGAFLSGGTDSSTLTGAMRKALGAPVNTFSIGFDVDGFDEMEYARIAAEHFDARQHEYYLTPQDVFELLPEIAAHTDQPFGNASAIPTLRCAQLARENGVTRMVAGDGGDELFAGNKRYARQLVFERYQALPKFLRTGLLEPCFSRVPNATRRGPIYKAIRYIEQARIPLPQRLETYNQVDWLGTQTVFNPDFLREIDTRHPHQVVDEIWQRADADSVLQRMLSLDLQITLADNDLRKVGDMCDLAGVEVAYPFLDDRMVDFSLTIPDTLKMKNGQLRWFFKHALKNFLPSEIINKSKHGFGLPFGHWVRDYPPLRELVSDAMSDLRQREIFNERFLTDLTGEHLIHEPGFYSPLLYSLTMLELWMQSHSN